MKYLFSLVFSFPICLSFAQTTYIDLLKKYADEKRVILNKQETYYLNIKDGLPTAYRDYLEEVLVIDPSTVNNGMAEIYFNTFSNISDIEGETQVGKEKFRINLYNDIETHDVSLSGIFYSDYKKKTIHFKRLEKGAKTRVAYKEEFIRPRMMPVFKVGDNAPILSTELRVIVSDNIHLGYKIFNNENETIEVKKIVDGVGRRVFIFQAKNVEKMLYEDSAPSYSCSAPHVIFYIKGYDTKDGYQPFLESDKDLYNWYNSLISNLNRTDETELQAITAKLIRYEETDEAKARTIFNWVQQKVKYIAFEDGMGGFIPREAADVCTKRYGDCKDMANLLNQMMTYAELDSYLVWVGTRNRPYSYKEVPTPIVDNHMIVAVKLSDEIIFLDATGQYVPFGYPTPFIQGKEAMVNLGVKHQIIKVPEMNATDNLNQNVIHINIEDDVLRCKGEKQLKGYSKMSFLHRVNDAGND